MSKAEELAAEVEGWSEAATTDAGRRRSPTTFASSGPRECPRIALLQPSGFARRCSTERLYLPLDVEQHGDGKKASATPGDQMHYPDERPPGRYLSPRCIKEACNKQHARACAAQH
jgi:hypothetical protein